MEHAIRYFIGRTVPQRYPHPRTCITDAWEILCYITRSVSLTTEKHCESKRAAIAAHTREVSENSDHDDEVSPLVDVAENEVE